MKTSSIAVETSQSTTQNDSIVRQTNKCSSYLSYTPMNNKHIFNDIKYDVNHYPKGWLSLHLLVNKLRLNQLKLFNQSIAHMIRCFRVKEACCKQTKWTYFSEILPLLGGGCSGVVDSALDFRSEGQWFVTQSLPWCCFLREETLPHIVSLHPGVQMGTSNILLGVTLRWTSIPSRGGVAILSVASR